MPVFGEQALGVELHAFDGVIAVADAHNGAVFRPRRDVQMLGQAGANYPEPCGFALLDGGLDSLRSVRVCFVSRRPA